MAKKSGLKPPFIHTTNILHLVELFNRGLDKDDQKEGLLKRLKNIEDKSEKQFKAINNKTKGIKKNGIEWLKT